MRTKGVEFQRRLHPDEIDSIQRRFKFQFPPDLRMFLQTDLPVKNSKAGSSFPNWRDDSELGIFRMYDWLDSPLDGICFDIENNRFWRDDWGEFPVNMYEAFSIARRKVAQTPLLIPIFGHRFIPAEPAIMGNPVFSVSQTDIIYYGCDLASYLHHEFGVPLPEWAAKTPRHIEFWSDICEPFGDEIIPD
jgi:hypothetical protein